eukprot:220455_1
MSTILGYFTFLLTTISCITSIPNQVSKIQVSPSTNSFIDSEGYTRFFHGGSQVNKDATHNNGLLYYTSSQLQQYKDWGFKVIRLGFLWNAYETAPNIFNEEYMDGIENLTNVFWEYDIMTMLDMHQDLWSPLFCGGHGIPEFYSYPNNSTQQYWKYHNKTYPQPKFAPNGYINDTYSNVFGKVDDTTCHWMTANTTIGWASTYNTYALSNAVQRFYDNKDDYLTKFATNFWLKVVQKFANNSAVLGYELINEPWVGDVFAYPELYTPKACDIINLRHVYAELNDIIRTYDNNTIIFYEPCTGGNDLDGFPCGFDTGPGGAGYNSKQSLSYHIYCPFIQSDVPINSSLIEECYLLNDLQWKYRLEDTKRLNTAGFLTEFGAIPYDELGFELIDYMMDVCDENLLSWIYWYITPAINASETSVVVPYLSRTYGYKIASNNVTKMFYNHTNKQFILQYEMYANAMERNLITEIYFYSELHYPNGIVYNVQPNNTVKVNVNTKENMISLVPINSQNSNVLLTFQMCPTKSIECQIKNQMH